MEKLSKIILTLAVLFVSLNSFAQTDYMVFKTEGTPLVKTGSSVKPLFKGEALSNKMMLVLNEGDELLYINMDGTLFHIIEAGNYNFNDLSNYNKNDNSTSVTASYFKYVWQSLNNKLTEKSKGGAVLRSEYKTLKSPRNSAKIIVKTLRFKWKKQDNGAISYLFIKDALTGKVLKFGTEDNALTLFVDETILKANTKYQWAVSKDKNSNVLEFQDFEIASSEEAQEYASLIKTLTLQLKKMGFKQKYITKRIQEDYNIYY